MYIHTDTYIYIYIKVIPYTYTHIHTSCHTVSIHVVHIHTHIYKKCTYIQMNISRDLYVDRKICKFKFRNCTYTHGTLIVSNTVIIHAVHIHTHIY